MYLVYSIAGTLAALTIFIIGFILYLKLTTGKCKSNVNLRGKTAIITGANTGIGYETALDFARRDAKVILACRSKSKGIEAVEKIIKQSNNTAVFFKELDLSSLKSVREFAEQINESEPRLDILVNNAGATGLPDQITEDGLMLLMQTNYFGHFLLTILLLDLMKRTLNSRIVNVSSLFAKYAKKLELNNLNDFIPNGRFKDIRLYCRSKLCNIYFTIKLAEELQGTSVTTYSLHPGGVLTELSRNRKTSQAAISRMIARAFLKTPREGAETTIYCSIAEGIENLSGQHFHDCHVVKRYQTARDPDLPEKLWKITEKMVNLN